MAIFNPAEAKHFASGLSGSGGPASSFRAWLSSASVPQSFSEGSQAFQLFREQSLGEVERLLLLSASNYRRSFDLMNDSSVSWMFVTLYYSGFYAAKALLGTFGAWKLNNGKKVLEPSVTAAGEQRFEVKTRSCSFKGSHQQFWDYFYSHSSSLKPYVPNRHHFALNPVSNDVIWSIRNRNEYNYDSFVALQLSVSHSAGFNPKSFPSSLPGALSTQFRVAENLLAVAGAFAESVGVETGALSGISSHATRIERIRDLVLNRTPPRLGNRVKRRIAATAGHR